MACAQRASAQHFAERRAGSSLEGSAVCAGADKARALRPERAGISPGAGGRQPRAQSAATKPAAVARCPGPRSPQGTVAQAARWGYSKLRRRAWLRPARARAEAHLSRWYTLGSAAGVAESCVRVPIKLATWWPKWPEARGAGGPTQGRATGSGITHLQLDVCAASAASSAEGACVVSESEGSAVAAACDMLLLFAQRDATTVKSTLPATRRQSSRRTRATVDLTAST